MTTKDERVKALEAVDKLREAAMGYTKLMSNGDAWRLDATIRAALSTDEAELSKRMYEAASAYSDLNVCYRIGRTPSESLFDSLDKANKAIAAYNAQRGKK